MSHAHAGQRPETAIDTEAAFMGNAYLRFSCGNLW
jgi:hypothetical protein